MIKYYLYSIAKPRDGILNQRILMHEKRHIEFILRENDVKKCWQLKLKIYLQNMISKRKNKNK